MQSMQFPMVFIRADINSNKQVVFRLKLRLIYLYRIAEKVLCTYQDTFLFELGSSGKRDQNK